MTQRIAIATVGKPGIALAYLMNRTRSDGSKRYGITVIRPDDCPMGNRWDVIIILPEPDESSQSERDWFAKWCQEVLPTKLAQGGEFVWIGRPRTAR